MIDIYEDGIENESADAMCDLGSLYYTGRAGEKNYEKAAYIMIWHIRLVTVRLRRILDTFITMVVLDRRIMRKHLSTL